MSESSALQLIEHDNLWTGRFTAMACPCEVLIETSDRNLAWNIAHTIRQEAIRIEHKYSRYRQDNIIFKINSSNGSPVLVDDETANLLDFAAECYALSNKKFDITSGVLRKAWKFDGSDKLPDQSEIDAIMPFIGWHQALWQKPQLTLKHGMEIDLGGMGKEYAVDQAAGLAGKSADASLLVNFGGDIFANKPRLDNKPWIIGVDDPNNTGDKALGKIELYQGGLTTSGDARRYLLKAGVRYGHILDPLTGWPVPDAPRSVTVIANTCLEAGMLSTFAMLSGKDAEKFLDAQQVKYWCIRY
jgi:thiamine biosynthesis lipoprotein